MGYSRAGFEVVGVDIEPQPHFPFTFYLADGLEFIKEHGHEFDFISASPPCQLYSQATKQWKKNGREYPDLIASFRDALIQSGKPYVLENVPGAPLINPIFLNGAMFGLYVHRPRYFECNFHVDQPKMPETPAAIKMGRPVKDGDYIQPIGHFSGVWYAKKQMEIDWMNRDELAQAIPPAYTEYIARQWMNA